MISYIKELHSVNFQPRKAGFIIKVIVDADACPKNCLEIIRKLAEIYRYEILTIASFNHVITNTRHIIVGDEPQATDIAVINHTLAGDIVVTQDWGLAAMVLGKNARAISPIGRIFRTEQIDSLLEERNILARYRKSGGRTKGPAKRRSEDDQHFETSFIALLQQPF